MRALYSNSSISGYKDMLPLQSVALPLKYPTKLNVKSANDEFNSKLSSIGGVIKVGEDNSTYIDYITYELLNDLRNVCLTPVNIKANNLDLKCQRLEIVLPHSIISNKCFSIYLKYSDNEDPILVIDIIDENYLFITLKIQLADFIEDKLSLTLDNFHNWGHISVPYSFELRSQPFLLKSVDDLNLIVSLKDGGLLHFQRANVLQDFDVYNFSNSSNLLSINIFSGLFKRDKQKADISLNGISSRCLVDLIVVDNFLITLCVSKLIQVWDLKTHQYVMNPIDLSTNDQESPSLWLTSVPTKYFQLIKSLLGKNYLALHTTFNSEAKEESEEFSGVKFSIWEFILSSSAPKLVPVENLSFSPSLPEIQKSLLTNVPSDKFLNLLWYVQDFEVMLESSSFTLNILWKSNTSSVLDTYSLSLESGTISSVAKGQLDIKPLLSESPLNHDTEYFSNKVLNSGRYDYLIISTSLNILREYVGLPPFNPNKKLKESVIETIKSTSKISEQDQRSSWLKLSALCEELRRSGEETISFVSINKNAIFTLQNNGMGLVRPSHYYETFLNTSNDASEGKLASILRRLFATISGKTFNKIYQVIIKEAKLTEESCSSLFDDFFKDKLSNSEIQDIINQLGSIPDILNVINSLVDGELSSPIKELSDSSEIATYLKLATIESFKNIKAKHESILLSLIILFLICEANNELLLISNKIITKLISYQILDCNFEICFYPDSFQMNERMMSCNLEYSLFSQNILSRDQKLVNLVKLYDFNSFFDYFNVNIITSYDKIVIDTCIELLNQGEGNLIKNKIFNKLNISRDMDRILLGLMYLENNEPSMFLKIFRDYDKLNLANNTQLIEKLSGLMAKNSKVSRFLKSIAFTKNDEPIRKANYYHSLADLSLIQSKLEEKQNDFTKLTLISTKNKANNIQNEFLESSLMFERSAIENLLSISNKSSELKETLNGYYLNTFDMALSLDKYDVAYDALSHIVSAVPLSKRKELFRKLISHLISRKSLYLIFESKNNVLRENYVLVEGLLLEMANNELTLSNSLTFYENLYSWRLFGASEVIDSSKLGDKRGAVEALYMFITRFKDEHSNLIASNVESFEDIKQYKLKILELYLIILNCLKSFKNEDDKWIIKFQDNQSLSILTLNEITVEYFEWLKELETDLK